MKKKNINKSEKIKRTWLRREKEPERALRPLNTVLENEVLPFLCNWFEVLSSLCDWIESCLIFSTSFSSNGWFIYSTMFPPSMDVSQRKRVLYIYTYNKFGYWNKDGVNFWSHSPQRWRTRKLGLLVEHKYTSTT